jgi:hypothetical protein
MKDNKESERLKNPKDLGWVHGLGFDEREREM